MANPSVSYDPPAFQSTPDIVFEQMKRLIEGYPGDAVLRELIQNADDAGATTFMAVISNAPTNNPLHRLVGGRPFLLLMNDGDFTEQNRHAIRNSHVSRKADGEDGPSPIGKFGLGMKSIFNWCEAFFCFHLTPEGTPSLLPFSVIPGEPTLPGVPSHVPNGADGFNIETANTWRAVLRGDEEGLNMLTLNEAIAEVAYTHWPADPTQSRLVFVVPLREESSTSRGFGLNNDYPVVRIDDKCSTKDFWRQWFEEDWPRLWPLLIGVGRLRRIVLINAAGDDTRLEAEMSEDLARPRTVSTTADVLDGVLTLGTGSMTVAHSTVAFSYRARQLERWSPPRPPNGEPPYAAQALWTPAHYHPDWPKNKIMRQGACAALRVLPAEAAVWIYELDAIHEGGEARWACGLPLSGVATQLGGNATRGRNARTQVVLHGSFDVDSLRTGLAFRENTFSAVWNRWLVTIRVLPLLSRAVDGFLSACCGHLAEQAARVRRINTAVAGLEGPSPATFGEPGFWDAVRNGGVVLPTLRLENGNLCIGYRLVAPLELETLLQFRLGEQDTTANGLSALDNALPGLRAMLAAESSLVVAVVSGSLPTFPATVPQNRVTAWLPEQVTELRPNASGNRLLDALHYLYQTYEILWGRTSGPDIREWLRGLLREAFDSHRDEVRDLPRPSRTELLRLATLCGSTLTGPVVTAIDLETGLRRVTLEHATTLLLPPAIGQ